MDMFLIGLIIYVFYIPIFLALLNFLRLKYENYSIFSYTVSQLGSQESPNYKTFNLSIAIFGFLSLFFVKNYANLLPNIGASKAGTFFLYWTCFSCLLIGLFPRDKRPRLHYFLSGLVFIGVFGSALFTIYPIYASKLIPNFWIILNFLVLGFTALLVISVKTKPKLKLIKKWVTNNTSFWEWSVFISAIIWDFTMAVVTLSNVLD